MITKEDVLLSDLRSICDATPKSGAKNKAGNDLYVLRFRPAVERAAAENRLVARCRQWLHSHTLQEGFIALIEAGRADLTLEAWVLDRNRLWHDLFTDDDRAAARSRLRRARAGAATARAAADGQALVPG